jgi:3-hydroxyisobutyrate dehydrogenase
VVNEQMFMFASGRNAVARTSTEEEMDPYFGGMGRLGRKDLECALSTAGDKGVVMPTAEFIRDRIVDVFLAKDESRPPK